MELFPQRNPIETAEIYGMVGGVPLYLMQFQNGGTLRELTEAALLDPNSILYEEPSILLMQGGVEGIAIQRGHRRHRKWTNPERGDSNRNWLHHSGNLVLPQRA